ncbi:DUF3630 family protein [Vibrio marisflavi]|uniref:Aminopeptidase n=1 Tax=Vibrio marisflavi CECT 7928 TaxID=634439 RepID=A0ABM9A9F8_9VIBR|nr:DUF3630 family protein [Vibrio marisflavi]CAH0542106.1 hypothetical protein VMF7928_04090 [Vibrio marisflavi CECT 7928]
MDNSQYQFGLAEFIPETGRIILQTPSFDYDSFPKMGEYLVALLSATIVEKQSDADVHSWLIDFEDCQLFLKAEHYSEAVWFEALSVSDSQEELEFLAQLLRRGI